MIVAGTLLIAILTLSLALSVSQMSSGKQGLRLTPVRETVLAVTSDLDRAIAYALGNASHAYRDLWFSNVTGDLERHASEVGRRFLSTWKRSVLTAYSNLGVGLEYANDSFGFLWGEGFGLSNVRCMVELNISAYGFTGWVGERNRAIGLNLDADSITVDTVNHETTLRFTVTEDGKRPVSDLAPENLQILAHISGGAWMPGEVRILQYDGRGEYILVFWPDVNRFSRSLIVTITTPEDQVVVAAYHRSEEKVQVTVDSQDQNRTSAVDHLGSAKLGGIALVPLPSSVDVYAGVYLLEYVAAQGYSFLNWTVGDESRALVQDKFASVTSVNITGSTTITAFYSTGGGPPSGGPGILLARSVEVNGLSQGMGMLWLRQKDGSNWIAVAGPDQTFTYPMAKAGVYALYFDPQPGYTFVNWTFQGDVSPKQGGGNPPAGPNVQVVDIGLLGGNATAFYRSSVNATVTLSSREVLTGSSTNKGWIRFNGQLNALPNSTSCAAGTYSLEFIPQSNEQFVGWDSTRDMIIVTNSTENPTTVRVQGTGSITALYHTRKPPDVPQLRQGNWTYLYVDEGYWLMPSDLWSGDDGKLAPSFSTGEDKQTAFLVSPETPRLRIAEQLFVIAWVRPNPPNSAKEINLTLTFQTSNGAEYLLGTATYPINRDDVYTMVLDSTLATYPDPGQPRIIPENSTFILYVTVTFRHTGGWGTFFLYHGISWQSYIYIGGEPV